MNYYTYPPSGKLEGFVRFFWVFESGELHEPYIYRSMADSCSELIFHYRGIFEELSECGQKSESFLSGVHAQTMKYSRFITNESFGIFGAYLYPFAVRQLFDLSPGELTNRMPDLHSVLGKDGKELEEQIMLAPDNSTRRRILTGFLENRLCKSSETTHPVLSAITYIIHTKKQHTVRELADYFNLSERQFERKFKEYSGFTPKRFMRIVRFSEACNYYKDAAQNTAFPGNHPGIPFTGNSWWIILLALIYRSIYTVAGGYVTAALAPGRPVRHAIILGCIGTVLGTLGAIAAWGACTRLVYDRDYSTGFTLFLVRGKMEFKKNLIMTF